MDINQQFNAREPPEAADARHRPWMGECALDQRAREEASGAGNHGDATRNCVSDHAQTGRPRALCVLSPGSSWSGVPM